MRQLRCPGNKLHAIVVDDEDTKPSGIIEVRCDSRFCGKQAGVIILHKFNLSTGEIQTQKYSEPNHQKG